jgi:CBS domain-containing protein
VRPCYGITAGRPHLRIESRFLPAGPTVVDEVANAALFLGLVSALPLEYGDPRTRLDFADAEANFHAAARAGLGAELRWVDGARVNARDLLLGLLLPLAREGLLGSGVDPGDAGAWLGLVHERVERGRTGAVWALETFDAAPPGSTGAERAWRVAEALRARCWSGQPGHEWPAGSPRTAPPPGLPPVTVVLRTDVTSVLPDAPLSLVARLLRWAPAGHVVVERASGEVAGIVSEGDVAAARAAGLPGETAAAVLVADRDPLVLEPATPLDEALATLRVAGRRCAAIVRGDHLAGVVCAADLARALASALRAAEAREPAAEVVPVWAAPASP